MLYINPASPSIKEALDQHYSHIRCSILKRLGSSCHRVGCWVCLSGIKPVKRVPKKLRIALSDDENLKPLICGTPRELQDTSDRIWQDMSPECTYGEWLALAKKKTSAMDPEEKKRKSSIARLVTSLEKVVNYDWFSGLAPTRDYSAYALARSLDIRSCTYCNRMYTSTMVSVEDKKIMRPQFDHWYPQSKFPLLALSFFNLIPCCSICNSSNKGNSVFDLDKSIHPYVHPDPTDDFWFSYDYDGTLGKYRIGVYSYDKSKTNAEETLKALHIDQMYGAHQEELEDLLTIEQAYPATYLNSIRDLFPGKELSVSEAYRIAFGIEPDTRDFHKRPLSKFKMDILKSIGIV